MKELFKLTPFRKDNKNKPKLFVIHHIGSANGKLYSVRGTMVWFTSQEAHRNKETGKLERLASAHFIIPRRQFQYNKEKYDILKFAEDSSATYHAGLSSWIIDGKKRKSMNYWSLGWELEGDGNLMEYTDFQYEILIESLKKKAELYKLSSDAIVGHEDVSPGRKVDPGKFFDWKRVRTGVEPQVMVPVHVEEADIHVVERVQPEEIVEEYTKDEEVVMESGEDSNIFVSLIQAILRLFG